MWDRSNEAHRAAGCTVGGLDNDRHSKSCPDKKYLAWVRRRPWKKLRDIDIVALDEDEAGEFDSAWDDFHSDKGCTVDYDTIPATRNHTGCDPRDRKDPGISDRWERLGNECGARGCEWPTGTDGWTHVEGCRFWRIDSPDDARRRIATNIDRALANEIPENALKVLRTIAATGLGDDESHTPSIDVMASRPYLCKQTGLEDGEVKAALAYLIRNAYLKKLDDIEEIGLGFMRRNARRLRQAGRPANWYRILPPPQPVEEPRPSYERLDALVAAIG